MTEDIKNKIEHHCRTIIWSDSNSSWINTIVEGAEYGYNLAEQEIERLKGLIEVAFKAHNIWAESGKRFPVYWEQFKKTNNL